MSNDIYCEIVSLAKRRGFFYQAYELYGGRRGFMTLGPLGVLLKENIIREWRRIFIERHENIFEIESPIINPGIVFKASGHVEKFVEPLLECSSCGRKYRADKYLEEKYRLKNVEGLTPEEIWKIIKEKNIKCECGGEFKFPRMFSLLFETRIGPYETGELDYLRPEAAQGMFIDFKNLVTYARNQIPFGVAQIGKVARNEISPRKGLIRLREFTIMEIELFFDPEDPNCEYLPEVEDVELPLLTADKQLDESYEIQWVTVKKALEKSLIKTDWQAYFMALALEFLKELGIQEEKQRFREQLPNELAHYSAQTYDQQVELSRWGWVEISGHAYRTDYDLKRHSKYSGESLTFKKQLEKPIEVESVEITPDMKVIGPMLRDKTQKFIEHLKSLPVEELKKLLNKEFIEYEGHEIPSSAIKFKIVKKKVNYKEFVPHVAEPSFGLERILYATLECAYRKKNGRTILSLPVKIAPIKVAVFPLVKRDGLPEKARKIYNLLRKHGIKCIYNDKYSIGKLYAEADEIGIPYSVTIDYETLKNDTVTVRDRDTWEQIRMPIALLPSYLKKRLARNE